MTHQHALGRSVHEIGVEDAIKDECILKAI